MTDDLTTSVRAPRGAAKLLGLWRFLWRGALGGVIVPFLFVVYSVYKHPNDMLAIPYLPIILLVTGFIGGAIGLIIGVLHFVVGMQMRVLVRTGVGLVFSMCLWIVYRYLRGDEGQPVSWLNLITETILFAVIIGALPAIMARPEKATRSEATKI